MAAPKTPPRIDPSQMDLVHTVLVTVKREIAQLCTGQSAEERRKHGAIALAGLINDGAWGSGLRSSEMMAADLEELAELADSLCAVEIDGIIDRHLGDGSSSIDLVMKNLLTPSSPLRKKARKRLADKGTTDANTPSKEYDGLVFIGALSDFLWEVVVVRIKEEVRKARIMHLQGAMADIRKKMNTEGTPQFEHAMEAKAENAREATQKALITFQAAMATEREEKERRMQRAREEKAKATAKIEMIQRETEALNSLLSSGSFDDPKLEKPESPPSPVRRRRSTRTRI